MNNVTKDYHAALIEGLHAPEEAAAHLSAALEEKEGPL